jgi:hypothetical protein
MVENEIVEVQTKVLPSAIELRTLESLLGGSQCDHCKIIFSSQVELQIHLFPSKEIISCSQCPSKFLTVKGMRQHFGKKHAKVRPYKCGICFKKFRNIYAARIHKDQVHYQASRLSCEFCGKSVFNKYSLTRHLNVCNKVNDQDG